MRLQPSGVSSCVGVPWSGLGSSSPRDLGGNVDNGVKYSRRSATRVEKVSRP